MTLSQNEVAKRATSITVNGQLEISQSILKTIGYDIKELKRGKKLVNDWMKARTKRDNYDFTRAESGTTRDQERRNTETYINALRDNIDELIDAPGPKQSLLDRAVIITDGSQKVSHKDADLINESLVLIERVRQIPNSYKQILAKHGWGDARLDMVEGMIRAFEKTLQDHQNNLSTKESLTETCQAKYKEMERWFRRAVRLIHRELMISDPQNQLRLVQKLDLPISHPSRRGRPPQNARTGEEPPLVETEPEEGSPETGEQPDETEKPEDTVSDPEAVEVDPDDAGVEDVDPDFTVTPEEEGSFEPEIPQPTDDGRDIASPG